MTRACVSEKSSRLAQNLGQSGFGTMVGSKFLAFVSDRLTKKMKKMLQEIVEDKKKKKYI